MFCFGITSGPAWQAWRVWRITSNSPQGTLVWERPLSQKLDAQEAKRRAAQQAEADAAEAQKTAQRKATLPLSMSAATEFCARDEVRHIIEKSINDEAGQANFGGMVFDPKDPVGPDWSKVGGRRDPRDSNVYLCVVTVSGSFNPKSYGNMLPKISVLRTYSVTDMDTQVIVQLDPAN